MLNLCCFVAETKLKRHGVPAFYAKLREGKIIGLPREIKSISDTVIHFALYIGGAERGKCSSHANIPC